MLLVGDLGVHGAHAVARVLEEFEIDIVFVILRLRNTEQDFAR